MGGGRYPPPPGAAPSCVGGVGRPTTLICGHFDWDRSARHPLLESLPTVIQLPAGDGPDAAWIATAVQLTVLESTARRPGTAAVVDRLAEALLIQVLRAHLDRLDRPAGFLAALGDPPLARALHHLHQEPGRGWTLDELARSAGMSRSHLAARFRETVGTTPIRYLNSWRMARAKDLLRATEQTIAQVAEHTGYQSEFAFAKAFKRYFGVTPGAARRGEEAA